MKSFTLLPKTLIGTACAFSVLSYGLGASAANLTPVDIELVFAIDASNSISQDDYDKQINSLNNIFSDPNFFNEFVKALPNKSLAVSAYQFGTVGQNQIVTQIADWTLINQDNPSSAASFGQKLVTGGQAKIGGLSPIGNAIDTIVNDLLTNDYEGHKVINLSSDGFNFGSTIHPFIAAGKAYQEFVTINALAIPASQSDNNSPLTSSTTYNLSTLQKIVDPYPTVDPQFKNKNFDGRSAFVMTEYADGEMLLEEAFRSKLKKETTGELLNPPDPSGDPDPSDDPQTVPEPSSLLGLLGISLLGLFGQRKRG
ncbi:DUF1194 domain-containing protein [Crocosphaera sp. XPORK-15E]|uniref:DUF1194 domain-containing protein n=1 Tax=Crocosphaera sp. XPORK-15E TaxID=3110247 RepID=UPI002B1F924E|nr:DUF1194 domain-containing protein [Crocosphaera sp. XPORK-15E]MEA5534883.1 DUF1194 domain-containing protein [Crocosphaera sp. XPORK-15E]